MQDMKDFVLWFMSQLPDFLMSDPISAFTGLAILFAVAALVRFMMHMR